MRQTDHDDRPPLHATTFRLGYADTDPAAILYYAAWFPFMERTQSEWFFLNGLRQDRIEQTHGLRTAIVHAECDYLVQVGLFDEIRNELRMGRIGGASFRLEHRMVRTADEATVARALVVIATLAPDGSAGPMPASFRRHLEAWAEGRRLDEPAADDRTARSTR